MTLTELPAPRVDDAAPAAPRPPRVRWRAAGRLARRRLLFVVPVLVVVSGGVFAVADASPFDPLAGYLGDRYLTASEQAQARIADELGTGRPWWQQYGDWLGGLLTGDLGVSRSFGQPVAQVLAERLPWTLLLTGVSLGLAVLTALLLGTWSAARRGGWVDRVVTSTCLLLQAVPPFVIALGAVALFALGLAWLPVAGLTDAGAELTVGQVARHLVLPAAVLAASQLPWLLLNVRQSLLAALADDAVLAARARGLAESTVVLRHALPTALLPFVTLLGARLPELVVGAVLVEEVFSWPGLAQAVVTSAVELDFPLLAVLTLLTTAAVLLGSLLADVAYVLLDPRVAADG
ncbi:ABC transporter permease [Modestobacter sp. VKM Ac-2984]|uniref:ABC transporter permease n=1 Tax=Modestobacter sp. VKM Ac-2984 TaxID=3004138 RepID=UPI0022AA8C4D|nr:ABC transporter permease [Modestobacter sp. VKM Ac-2984]MCZ2815607.1 ABC transporter permease [Modestobacter sp. VKM Ac-2984]